jgi:hypothetical protein
LDEWHKTRRDRIRNDTIREREREREREGERERGREREREREIGVAPIVENMVENRLR